MNEELDLENYAYIKIPVDYFTSVCHSLGDAISELNMLNSFVDACMSIKLTLGETGYIDQTYNVKDFL